MTRITLERQLNDLNSKLIEMFSYVEKLLKDSKDAVIKNDKELAKTIVQRENVTDALEKQIEDLCLQIILRQQPVASDLRYVTASLKIITDLERIGDQSEDISEIVLSMSEKNLEDLNLLPQMFDETISMLKQAIDSFVVSNIELAKETKLKDDIIDDLFDEVRNKVIEKIKIDSEEAEIYIDILQVAKYLERIGDHSENIAEWVIYTKTGDHEFFYKK